MPLARNVSRARDCQQPICMLVGCPPNEAVTTAIGILDAYRLARSWGVRFRRRRNRPRQMATGYQLRPPMKRRNAVCQNKSHDLLRPEAQPAAAGQSRPPESLLTLRQPMEDRGRFGTKSISNTNKGCRSDSFPLTSLRPVHIWVHNSSRTEGDHLARPNRRVAPLSSELWHCAAYPAVPEATWTQPLTPGRSCGLYPRSGLA